MKRIFLFLATNIAILLVLSIVLRLLGVDRILDAAGRGPRSSRPADLRRRLRHGRQLHLAAAVEVDGQARDRRARDRASRRTTRRPGCCRPSRHQAQAAGIGMPEVAIFDSPRPNAFATGARRNAALVAVSTGLLRSMRRDEVEAVLGHEISHVANGDMVTLALIQGVVNTFVLFFSRVIGSFVDRVVFRNERGHGPASSSPRSSRSSCSASSRA